MLWAQMVCWQCCYDACQTNQCRDRNIRRSGRERVERTPGGTACMSDHMAKAESGQRCPALPRRFSLVQLERLRRLMRCRAIVTRNRGRHRITWSRTRTPSWRRYIRQHSQLPPVPQVPQPNCCPEHDALGKWGHCQRPRRGPRRTEPYICRRLSTALLPSGVRHVVPHCAAWPARVVTSLHPCGKPGLSTTSRPWPTVLLLCKPFEIACSEALACCRASASIDKT
jgi:hypothetical protein